MAQADWPPCTTGECSLPVLLSYSRLYFSNRCFWLRQFTWLWVSPLRHYGEERNRANSLHQTTSKVTLRTSSLKAISIFDLFPPPSKWSHVEAFFCTGRKCAASMWLTLAAWKFLECLSKVGLWGYIPHLMAIHSRTCSSVRSQHVFPFEPPLKSGSILELLWFWRSHFPTRGLTCFIWKMRRLYDIMF